MSQLKLNYNFSNGMEYMKTVTESARQVAPRTLIRGFRDDFVDVADDVVLLEGETHLERKPVSYSHRNGKSELNAVSIFIF